MKISHLCARHRQVVQQDREQACRLWHGAYAHGVEACRAENWRCAEAFLGTAYEIALVRFAVDMQQRHRCLSSSQFAAVGRHYANVLCRLKKFEAAESCLRRIHDGLLHWSEARQLPYEERLEAFEQCGEFRQKLVALLQLTGGEAAARCTDLLTGQVAKQVAASLYQ